MVLPMIVLILALAVLLALLGSSCRPQVQLLRRLFRNKGMAPEYSRQKVSLLRDIDYHSVFAHGRLDIYTPNDTDTPQPVLIWVHGGGYVGSDKSCAAPWGYVIAAQHKATVVSINYCRAPEQRYPCPLLQIDEAVRFLTDNAARFCLDASCIFLAGDSAGAQLASQYAAAVCNADLQKRMGFVPKLERSRLKGILLCCGFYNMDTVMQSHFPALKTFLWAYTDAKKISKFARKDEMSTVRHLGDNFCNVYLTCGDGDPFIGQSHELAAALEQAGVSCEVYLPQGRDKKLGHEYQFSIGTEAADISLLKALDFIEKHSQTAE